MNFITGRLLCTLFTDNAMNICAGFHTFLTFDVLYAKKTPVYATEVPVVCASLYICFYNMYPLLLQSFLVCSTETLRRNNA